MNAKPKILARSASSRIVWLPAESFGMWESEVPYVTCDGGRVFVEEKGVDLMGNEAWSVCRNSWSAAEIAMSAVAAMAKTIETLREAGAGTPSQGGGVP